MEHWQELLDLVLDWTFVPLGLALLLAAVVGSGVWRGVRWRRAVWVLGVGLCAGTLYLGLQRHELGEVLFNGQLL